MKVLTMHIFFLYFLLSVIGCTPNQKSTTPNSKNETDSIQTAEVIVGARRFHEYVPLLQNKRVALVVNQTSVVHGQNLVDVLLDQGIQVVKVFAPEHGFRGTADAGDHIKDGIDTKTGLPILSLYGSNRKPSKSQLQDVDIVVFDIQDVGARFYTYISTLQYVMEACAENNKPCMVLDRPNPNGHFVDGPVLDPAYKSFVGMQSIPVVHGMTVGEYARFLNGERLLEHGNTADLIVITCENYDHTVHYTLPIAPSPNLPNQRSILLYPSLCFFEGTDLSVGRGTTKQFQLYGSPVLKNYSFEFTPISRMGAQQPKHQNQKCYGVDLSLVSINSLEDDSTLNLSYLLSTYKNYQLSGAEYFTRASFFDKLAGTDQLRKQIEAGLDEDAIRLSWQDDLLAFKKIRSKYLLYKDFT